MQTAAAATKKLLIGNLPDNIAPNALKEFFNKAGKVLSFALLNDGFAFVEMNAEEADRAMMQLNGYRWNGRTIIIDEAHPRSRSRY